VSFRAFGSLFVYNKGDIGQPCLQPLDNAKVLDIIPLVYICALGESKIAFKYPMNLEPKPIVSMVTNPLV